MQYCTILCTTLRGKATRLKHAAERLLKCGGPFRRGPATTCRRTGCWNSASRPRCRHRGQRRARYLPPSPAQREGCSPGRSCIQLRVRPLAPCSKMGSPPAVVPTASGPPARAIVCPLSSQQRPWCVQGPIKSLLLIPYMSPMLSTNYAAISESSRRQYRRQSAEASQAPMSRQVVHLNR